jgi:Fibronectin type III domain/Protein of unknown function (DUF4038)
VREVPLALDQPVRRKNFREIWYEESGDVGDSSHRVLSVRPCVRTGRDGFVLRETVVEYHQRLEIAAAELAREAAITAITSQDNHAVAVRMAGTAKTFYFCDAGAIRHIGKFVNGAHATLATVSATIHVNDVVRCEAQGSTIRYLINGALAGSATDTSITSGRPGFFLSTSDGRADNWAGGDLDTAVISGLKDTTAPAVPTNLQAVSSTSSSISLSWNASTDNVGVSGYWVFRNGAHVATTASTAITDSSLSSSTQYTYAVSAVDAAGNQSSQSAPVTATTTAAQSTSRFPVRISANGRTLVDGSGKPFPILGRTAWFVISLSAADYQTFIADSVSRGYNSIEMHVLDHDSRGNRPPFAGNGAAPFLKRLDGTNWNGTLGGSAPDFTTPNEVYWSCRQLRGAGENRRAFQAESGDPHR